MRDGGDAGDNRLLSPERARLYGGVFLVLALIFLGLFVQHLVQGDGVQRNDRDFLSFYAAAGLAWGGEAASVWNRGAHEAAQITVLGAQRDPYAFYYPPTYLLACLPVGVLPLFAAYLAWLAGTAALLVAAMRHIGLGWLAIAVLVLSPAGILTIITGQNAFLTTALFAFAGLTLAGRPGLAGLCFGLLTMKPQLGLMVVPALVAARRWWVLGWATGAALGFAALSAAVLGIDTWEAFLAGRAAAQSGLEGELQSFKMQSVFATAQQFGAGTGLAYTAQVVAAVAVVAALWPCLRRRSGGMLEVATMVSGGLLMTPFLQFYDLLLLTLPMIALAQAAARDGAMPGERAGLLLLLLGPGLSFASGAAIGVSFGPVLALIAVLMLRRRMMAGGISPC